MCMEAHLCACEEDFTLTYHLLERVWEGVIQPL